MPFAFWAHRLDDGPHEVQYPEERFAHEPQSREDGEENERAADPGRECAEEFGKEARKVREEEAEDLVQDTYTRVLSKPRMLRNDDPRRLHARTVEDAGCRQACAPRRASRRASSTWGRSCGGSRSS